MGTVCSTVHARDAEGLLQIVLNVLDRDVGLVVMLLVLVIARAARSARGASCARRPGGATCALASSCTVCTLTRRAMVGGLSTQPAVQCRGHRCCCGRATPTRRPSPSGACHPVVR